MNSAQTIAGLLGGAAVALVFWELGRQWLRDAPALLRDNLAGRPVPASGGLPIMAAALVSLAAAAVVLRATDGPVALARITRFELPVGTLVLGFGLVGLVDDIFGDDAKGFRGHVARLFEGRLTTGFVKLGGGAAVALLVVSVRAANWKWLLIDAATVALAANLANLLDRAPGRLLKASVVAGGSLVALGWGSAEVAATAPVMGGSWAMLPADLREKTMLGDCGANVVGAVLGFLAVELAGRPTQVWLLAGMVVANLLSEVVSYSRVIDAVPPLRWLDRLGSLRN